MINQQIKQQLEKAEYKLTVQRQAILQVMQDRQGQHLTAEEVLLQAKKKVPNLGIATVYRTLERLAELGILCKAIFDEGKYRYELSELSDHQHHHTICVKCGRISEVEGDLLHLLEKHLEDQGYEVVDHQLQVFVCCPHCLGRG